MRARPIYKNTELFITRRIHGRQFRLLPSKKTNQVLGYFLAVLAKKYDIDIVAVCVMSNHWHAEIIDNKGQVVNFTRDFHSFTARHLNILYRDVESMWSSEQTSHVVPLTDNDKLGRIAYTMANPVKAGLVQYGHRWPGIIGCYSGQPLGPVGRRSVR